jgi:hypothetical protein
MFTSLLGIVTIVMFHRMISDVFLRLQVSIHLHFLLFGQREEAFGLSKSSIDVLLINTLDCESDQTPLLGRATYMTDDVEESNAM